MFGEEFVVHPGEIQISRSTNFRDRMDTVDDRLAFDLRPSLRWNNRKEKGNGMEKERFNWSSSVRNGEGCKRIAIYPSQGGNTVIVILIESTLALRKVRRNAATLTRPR